MRFEVEAILFDIDGTLADSTGAVVRTWRRWAAQHGMNAEEILRVCHGRRTEDTLALFLPSEQCPDAAAAGIQAGRAAGAPTLAVATSHDASALLAADAVVHDMSACALQASAEGLLLTTT
jgi:mannitol-1-/sugar-/sorbitol-6-phosphatase